jgi:serine/threonine protein kinase
MSLHTHKSDGSDDANTAHLPTTVEPTASLDQKALRVAKSNPDFLPLVSEDNILRVNNVPYAKLGVIGKGGSCKVYRALAKDCSILAIKKVKLGGMDKKAINGYANEIALLKRLRGNPAIIQMYDSEVDLSRKAIYLCMELGEVDLSQVIQQQTMGTSTRDGKTSRSTLDMNFIRLTWQQMLKAVHSIHEERIIHGDLKPANFLFVRGALKLIDFGIAKAIQSDDTTNIYRDSQIGTLNYMSPEAILDTGSGTNGARMRIGRVSLFVIWNFEI